MALSERGVYYDQWLKLHRDRHSGRWWDHHCECPANDFHPPKNPTPKVRLSLKELCANTRELVASNAKARAKFNKIKDMKRKKPQNLL